MLFDIAVYWTLGSNRTPVRSLFLPLLESSGSGTRYQPQQICVSGGAH
jgi:hypothetical protein